MYEAGVVVPACAALPRSRCPSVLCCCRWRPDLRASLGVALLAGYSEVLYVIAPAKTTGAKVFQGSFAAKVDRIGTG